MSNNRQVLCFPKDLPACAKVSLQKVNSPFASATASTGYTVQRRSGSSCPIDQVEYSARSGMLIRVRFVMDAVLSLSSSGQTLRRTM